MKEKTKHLTYAGLLLSLGLLLPFVTSHAFGVPGTVLLPMHIPVLLCGLLCGPFYGGVVGLCLPLLSSVLTGMPVLYPMVPIMTAELGVYGAVSGLLYRKTRLGRMRFGIYPALILAMLCGRAAYGLMFGILFFLTGSCKAPAVWTAVATGIPGIVLQLLFLPAVVTALNPSARRREDGVKSSVNLIKEDRAAVLVLKEGVIVRSATGHGVAPLLSLYEEGALKDAYIVDKVVGKAAAMLMVAGGASGCHAVTISENALSLFRNRKIPVEYEEIVPFISNRKGTGMCPMEEAVLSLEDETKAPAALKERMAALRAAAETESTEEK